MLKELSKIGAAWTVGAVSGRAFLAAVALFAPSEAQAQQPIPSVPIPPATERTIVFIDRGRLYQVGLDTGRVAWFEGTLPGPNPPGPPVPPDPEYVPDLTGFPMQVYAEFTAAVPSGRKAIADDLLFCLSVTTAKAGGLSLSAQDIVNELSAVIKLKGLDTKLKGFKLGTLIASQGASREAVLKALVDVESAMRAVR